MSQNPEQQGDLGSEDIFNTEELLQGHEELPLNTENVSEFPEEASIDLEDQIEESELEEVEAIEEAEGADMEVEEMTEDQETEGTTEGDQSLQQIPKPAKKAVHNSDKLTELPLSKVKHIIKLDPEVNLVNAEAVYLITKATESFVRSLGKESFNFANQQKKKTITKQHVDSALEQLPIEL